MLGSRGPAGPCPEQSFHCPSQSIIEPCKRTQCLSHSPWEQGAARERQREEEAHPAPLQTCSAPATPSGRGLPRLSSAWGTRQRQPGIWCLQFFSDKWHVSRAAERAGWLMAPVAAPSGGIVLLYADELITVSSIWLFYKKVPAPHTVSTATRGPTTLQRECITI